MTCERGNWPYCNICAQSCQYRSSGSAVRSAALTPALPPDAVPAHLTALIAASSPRSGEPATAVTRRHQAAVRQERDN
jgi:hypothetical protein